MPFTSPRPAVVFALALVLAAVAAWPGVAQEFDSLDPSDPGVRSPQAIRELEALLAKTDPASDQYTELSVRLADVYRQRGDHRQAARVLSSLLEQRPTLDGRTALLSLRLALTLRSTRQYEDAIALLEPLAAAEGFEALPLQSRFHVRLTLAQLYLETARVPEARERYLALLEAFPEERERTVAGDLIELYTLGGLSDDEFDAVLASLPDDAFQTPLVSRLLRAFEERQDAARFEQWHARLVSRHPEAALALVEQVHAGARGLGLERALEQQLAAAAVQPSASDEAVLAYAQYLTLEGNQEGALGVARTREGRRFLELQADLLAARRRYDEALPLLQELVRLDPNNPDRYEALGLALAELGRKEEAVAAWRTLPELAPVAAVEGWLRVAQLCRRYGYEDEARLAQNKLQQARIFWERDPARLSVGLLQAGRYDAAVANYLETARTLGAPDVDLRESFLLTVRRLSAEAEAEAAIAGALSSLKKDGSRERDWLLDLRCDLLIAQAKYREAVEAARGATPDTRPALLYRVGAGLARAGAGDAAVEALERVDPEVRPYGVLAAQELAAIYRAREAWEDAERELGRLVLLLDEDSPAREESLFELAETRIRRNDAAGALEALALVPAPATEERQWPAYIVLRAEAQLMLGAVRAASGELRAVLDAARQPHWRSRATVRLADVALWEGDFETAKTRYADFVAQDPAGPYAAEALDRLFMLNLAPPDVLDQYRHAVQYEWQGRHDDAITAYRETAAALRDYPDGAARALLGIARLEARRGRTEAAATECERALRLAKQDRLEAEIRWLQLGLEQPGSDDHRRRTLERFIIDYPDTIYADYARAKLNP